MAAGINDGQYEHRACAWPHLRRQFRNNFLALTESRGPPRPFSIISASAAFASTHASACGACEQGPGRLQIHFFPSALGEHAPMQILRHRQLMRSRPDPLSDFPCRPASQSLPCQARDQD